MLMCVYECLCVCVCILYHFLRLNIQINFLALILIKTQGVFFCIVADFGHFNFIFFVPGQPLNYTGRTDKN